MAQSLPDDQASKLDSAIRDLIINYHELNATVIDELYEEPSALEFMQYVARNRPFVVRKGAQDWTAVQKWDSHYLLSVLGDSLVNVAITPFGNADAVLKEDDGSLSYVKPLERLEPFDKVIRYISEQESNQEKTTPIKYAQTQNDNLRNEYSSLFEDVPSDIPFARIALRKNPEAVNFWLGNSLSTTSLHKDNYENIYVQVRGQKHFVIMPPVAAAAVNEQDILGTTYTSTNDDEEAELKVEDLKHTLDEPELIVPVPTWDPDFPDVRSTPYSELVKPLRITLSEGDMMYLPAQWYHKVGQSCGDEGYCCAVNYWLVFPDLAPFPFAAMYDMEFGGSFWASNAFARDIARAVNN
ncbi:Clavaminate synthase-like protein [Aureobasidium pullulans]|uniref:Clavaminate synthase-like protein n=1 Tax=Aureobasidium pullulans TaxID=5580 RepID=A0A4V4I9C7_AURPU|nr:Clavaminate synthase-like protein [Aureobasidium pullulans]THW29421.1 Clavaminate synthase-like protein [Aureobasidium pullulans]THX38185.1 Clavaminate synthase-like protein [Aureobasidium pullulans]THY00993.1 Clavaminate synthase-like protein [Aureobasidium pullulans]THY63467.1 Clavaminate synthase-like protein [Aureobasidium pullulans]